MKFAVIGDIHGNKFALESVFEDIKLKNIDFIISTGDIVGYLPFPNEVIEVMRRNRILVVKGNHDKFIAESEKVSDEDILKISDDEIQSNASAIFTNWVISDENRSYLKNLPSKLTMECQGFKIIVVHGSPMSIDEYLYEDEEHLLKISEIIRENIVICGHTHVPYCKKLNNKYFINAGSVGKPKHGGSESTYVIVNIENGKVSYNIEKVTYDIKKIVNTIDGNRMISNKLIAMLEKGF